MKPAPWSVAALLLFAISARAQEPADNQTTTGENTTVSPAPAVSAPAESPTSAPDIAAATPTTSHAPATTAPPPAKPTEREEPWSPWPMALLGGGLGAGGACIGVGVGFVPVLLVGLQTQGAAAMFAFPLIGVGAFLGAMLGTGLTVILSFSHYDMLPAAGMLLGPSCIAGAGGCLSGGLSVMLGIIMGNSMNSEVGGIAGSVIALAGGTLTTAILTAISYSALAVWLPKEESAEETTAVNAHPVANSAVLTSVGKTVMAY